MGFFNKHKENEETKQTNDIKQATISDTQKSSISQTPQQQNQSVQNLAQTQQQNFANPFANQTPQQNQQQPIQEEFENSNMQNQTPQQNQTTQNSTQTQQQNFEMQNLQNSITPQSNNALNKEEITEMIDETVEKLIEEKWDSMINSVNKIIKWKDITENQINLLKDDILNISEGFSKLESKLINKISSYDKNILDVNSEIKALEKVFQKITPTLINNVNELSRIADNFKDGAPNKTKKLPTEEPISTQETKTKN